MNRPAQVLPLERRRLLAAFVDGGTLRIDGTDGDDVVRVERRDGEIVVTLNGEATTFDPAPIRRVRAFLGDGDDSFGYRRAYNFGGGGASDVTVYGGAGDDSINVSLDDATLHAFAGTGNDLVIARSELRANAGRVAVTLYGQGGDDNLVGNAAADLLIGGRGDDFLQGGRGDDTLLGESGDDTLMGNGGGDRLVGGLGDDALTADSPAGPGGPDTLLGGAGNDTLTAEGDDLADGGAGDDSLTGRRGSTLLGRDGADTLRGGWAGQGDNLLDGGDGADVILGSPGHDTFIGGPGPDRIGGAADEARLLDQSPEDTHLAEPVRDGRVLVLFGTGGDDVMRLTLRRDVDGRTVADYAIAGSLDETVIDPSATATLDLNGLTRIRVLGGAGDDTLYYQFGRPVGLLPDPESDRPVRPGQTVTAFRPDVALDLGFHGGPGNDVLASLEPFTAATADTIHTLRFFGGDGDDRATANADTAARFYGGPGDDTLRGERRADLLTGGPGGDRFVTADPAEVLDLDPAEDGLSA